MRYLPPFFCFAISATLLSLSIFETINAQKNTETENDQKNNYDKIMHNSLSTIFATLLTSAICCNSQNNSQNKFTPIIYSFLSLFIFGHNSIKYYSDTESTSTILNIFGCIASSLAIKDGCENYIRADAQVPSTEVTIDTQIVNLQPNHQPPPHATPPI